MTRGWTQAAAAMACSDGSCSPGAYRPVLMASASPPAALTHCDALRPPSSVNDKLHGGEGGHLPRAENRHRSANYS